MAFTVEDAVCNVSTIKKHIVRLKKPVQQTKHAILDKLKKSEKRYNEEINSVEEIEKKTLLQKKLDKIIKERNVLENLLEDDIVNFAFTTQDNLMAIASNRRMPLVVRMKARVASHKPLSTYLNKIKSKRKKAEGSEDEEESANDEPENNTELKNQNLSEDTEESDIETSKPLDKMVVNNQIVKMRKYVKQAKVYIIHKMTRNITKLRRVNGKNEEKYKKKADRLVKKIQCLKDMSEDDISRFALTCTQDLTKLSSDINSSLKQQVMAIVATHKCVLPTIVDFKNKYPNWDKSVPTILKQKKKKRKLNAETTENSKENNKSSNKKSKISSDNKDSEESEDDKDGNESENDLSDEESGQTKSDEQNYDDSEQSDESEADSRKGNQNNFGCGKIDIFENENHVDSNGEIESVEYDKVGNKNRKTNKTLLIKNSTNITKSLNENNNSSSKENKVSNSSKKVDPSKKSSIKKTVTKQVVDPFFVTSTNEEYVTSQVPSVSENAHSSWKDRNKNTESRESDKFHNKFRKWDRKDDHRNQRRFNKFDNQPSYNKATFSEFNKGHTSNKTSAITNFVVGNRKERRKALHQPLKEETPDKLHPSWEAKKKLSSIVNFKGKKITFD